ncbi:MAG: Phage terminase, small subunit [Gammaproteobacteria bacterium]|nr:Phage terminase, small subunit [Gammaproteobacteria bacterium]
MSDKPKPPKPIHPITKKIIERQKKVKRRSKATSAYQRLDVKLQRAVDVLVMGGTQAQAAIAAGYANKASQVTLRVRGHQIAHKPAVQAALKEREQEAREEAGLTLTRSWLETRRIAYFDPLKLFDKRGNILTPKQLDEDTRAAVANFEVEERIELVKGKKVIVRITRYKFWNKVQALKMHLRGLGAVPEDLPSVVIHNDTYNTQANMEVTTDGVGSADGPIDPEMEYQRLMGMTPVIEHERHHNTDDSPPDTSPPDSASSTTAPPDVTFEHQDITPENVRSRRKRIRRAARASVDEAMEIWKKLGQKE